MTKLTFALFFGNRGFFPGELIADARRELIQAVEKAGYGYIAMDEKLTRFGAVETREEGRKYAAFLREHAGQFQGVILCMPNFSDENGAQAALSEAGVPILVQAYRDMPGKMDFAHRRDSMCGKFAMCNVLRQCGIKYTIIPPFTVDPGEEVFQEHLQKFAGICRIVKTMRRMNLGSFGARTTAFKTVRVDEIGLQRHGINIESFDLSQIFRLMKEADSGRIEAKKKKLLETTQFNYEAAKLDTISRLGVVIDNYIEEYQLDAVAIRCWDELELSFGVAPCLLLGELNERGIAAGCEVDIANAIIMKAISLAGDSAPMLLDINNNFGLDDNKSILFHCGPVPISLMEGKGITEEHLMFRKSLGAGSGVGINHGQIRQNLPVTFGSAKTEDGKIWAFLGEGYLTGDAIEEGFFGCGVVMEHPRMGEIVDYVGKEGYRHHLSLTAGKTAWAVREALEKYLGYEIHSF
ncbi:L-fucose/L-arabinose isomerase family protein [Leadbettera azotonutricia]|uniref:L-fucose isomerase domain protein n=1 Tax=Leadbettera azotonutricia (strain ATCC BAA-888 / DSM 13862 / ZAS-9) TaxID=545695 RepID=F5YEA7_LEAAZ|nr:L-fucose isomerase [Leadbettera azotonutricia]AEF80177.1 L-fucose isomerase domain protein [Leadbettera azotonutricia ZAS-9]